MTANIDGSAPFVGDPSGHPPILSGVIRSTSSPGRHLPEGDPGYSWFAIKPGY
jgi:hypothetical protein